MAINEETLQRLMAGMTQAITQAMAAVMQQPMGMNGKIDSRAIGGPPEWDSGKDESQFMEWHVKVKAWLGNQDDRAQRWLDAARDTDHVVETQDLNVQVFDDDSERTDCKKFNSILYNILVTKLKGRASISCRA